MDALALRLRVDLLAGGDELPRREVEAEVLLVDPLGNLMMRFPLSDDPKGMLEDIKKLLRLSRIG